MNWSPITDHSYLCNLLTKRSKLNFLISGFSVLQSFEAAERWWPMGWEVSVLTKFMKVLSVSAISNYFLGFSKLQVTFGYESICNFITTNDKLSFLNLSTVIFLRFPTILLIFLAVSLNVLINFWKNKSSTTAKLSCVHWNIFPRVRRITTFVLCSQSPLNLNHFCLTRFEKEAKGGWN